MKTIIMAGGKGTRIQSVVADMPKPLIEIAGKPILQWELETLREQGFTDIILTVSHLADKIIGYFGDGSAFGVHIEYFVEEMPLGNAGALFKLWESRILSSDEDFLLLNADMMFDVDFHRFLAFHKEYGGVATLFTHPNSHPYDSALIIADDTTHVVEEWLAKEDVRPAYYKNRVNAGLHILNTEIFRLSGIDSGSVGMDRKVDLDRDVLKSLVPTGSLMAYESPEYVKDMGTPERINAVSRDLTSGRVHSRNLSLPQKAVFLDRDGTVNKYVGFIRKTDEFELLPGVSKAIRLINDSGYLCIVITNQPVVARGEVSILELNEIHNKMETLLGKEGAYIDALYYCPHHPDRGFEGEISELKVDCDCRKPKPGLLFRAAADFHIDLSSSWMIGDSEWDMEAGKSAGCRTVLLDGIGMESKTEKMEQIKQNLLSAVQYILS